MLKVGVKYCGNCNPHFDGPRLVESLKLRVRGISWLPADDPKRDLLLIVSGCPVDCATRPEHAGPTVVVAGATVDYVSCDPAEIIDIVLDRLEQFKQAKKREPIVMNKIW